MIESLPVADDGPLIPRVAFGGAGIGGHDYGSTSDDESVRAIHRALDLGLSAFDVADVYGFGRAERVLGEALARRGEQTFVATKVGVRWDDAGRTRRDLSGAYLRTAVEGSLRRLRMPVIPLLQLHWPDPSTSLVETADALHSLIADGKVARVGVCNFPPAPRDALRALIPLATHQVPINAGDRTQLADARRAVAQGLRVLAYSVLAQGVFATTRRTVESFHGTDLRRRGGYFSADALPRMQRIGDALASIAAAIGRTPAQVAIRWVLDRASVTIALVGIKHEWQADEAAGALGWRLPDDAAAVLDDVADHLAPRTLSVHS